MRKKCLNGGDEDPVVVQLPQVSPFHTHRVKFKITESKTKPQSQYNALQLLSIYGGYSHERRLIISLTTFPIHAFGGLKCCLSGITDDMLDGLMALKDMDDVPGLPPLSAIEDMRYEKNTRKFTRADIERSKQEEIANARVRQIDSQCRAYGTGKGNVVLPVSGLNLTKTLGLLDVNCTVKGSGVSGQIGAIRLGMSRAPQNWAPDQFRSVLL
ncbi:28S ribosomal protein S9, mitochondrial [Tanacetum coccineum]